VVIAGGALPFAESDMVSSLVMACCSERARHFVEECGEVCDVGTKGYLGAVAYVDQGDRCGDS
jgi:hypothetical protein